MSMELIKIIREETSLSLKDIKKAIEETKSDNKETVIKYLREQGILKAGSRTDRATAQGSIFSYIHEGRIGCMLILKCETDFVARSEDFKKLGNDLCLHITAYTPKYISSDEVDQNFVESELEIARTQLENDGRSSDKMQMILKGKEAKIKNEVSLLSQGFLIDPTLTVEQYIMSIGQKTGEHIKVDKFVILSLN